MNLKYLWTSGAFAAVAAASSIIAAAQPVPPPPPAPPPIAYPTPAPRPGPNLARPATPANNPGSWVMPNDYPSRALREERSGITGFRVTVGPDGWVTACQITSSSGHPDLDAATCANISVRARFTPALDYDGNPTAGTYSNRVRWVIPSEGPNLIPGIDYLPLPVAGAMSTSMMIDQDGVTSACQVTQSSGDLAARSPVGPIDCALSFYEGGYTDRRGQPLARTVLTQQTVAIAVIPERFVPPTTAQVGQVDDGRLAPAAGRVVRSYIVEVDGTQAFCQVVSASGEAASRYRTGTYDCPTVRFLTPFRDEVGRPERRQVTVTEVVSFAGRR